VVKRFLKTRLCTAKVAGFLSVQSVEPQEPAPTALKLKRQKWKRK